MISDIGRRKRGIYKIKALKTFQLIENWVFLKDILKKDYQRVVKELALLFFQTQSHLCGKILKTKRGMELVTSTLTVSAPLPFCWGDNFQSQILKRGGLAKNECLGGLKEFLAWIFAWGAYYFSCQKNF